MATENPCSERGDEYKRFLTMMIKNLEESYKTDPTGSGGDPNHGPSLAGLIDRADKLKEFRKELDDLNIARNNAGC